jgi:hypothetical protein
VKVIVADGSIRLICPFVIEDVDESTETTAKINTGRGDGLNN